MTAQPSRWYSRSLGRVQSLLMLLFTGVKSLLSVFLHKSSKEISRDLKIPIILTPSLQMRKLKLGEVRQLVPSDILRQKQELGLQPRSV